MSFEQPRLDGSVPAENLDTPYVLPDEADTGEIPALNQATMIAFEAGLAAGRNGEITAPLPTVDAATTIPQKTMHVPGTETTLETPVVDALRAARAIAAEDAAETDGYTSVPETIETTVLPQADASPASSPPSHRKPHFSNISWSPQKPHLASLRTRLGSFSLAPIVDRLRDAGITRRHAAGAALGLAALSGAAFGLSSLNTETEPRQRAPVAEKPASSQTPKPTSSSPEATTEPLAPVQPDAPARGRGPADIPNLPVGSEARPIVTAPKENKPVETKPEVPTATTDPEAPTKPSARPSNPENPGGSSDDPDDPEEPGGSGTPTKPTEPSSPGTPTEPGTPPPTQPTSRPSTGGPQVPQEPTSQPTSAPPTQTRPPEEPQPTPTAPPEGTPPSAEPSATRTMPASPRPTFSATQPTPEQPPASSELPPQEIPSPQTPIAEDTPTQQSQDTAPVV